MQLSQALLNTGIVTSEDVTRVEAEIKAEESNQRKLRRESRAKAILANDPNIGMILMAQQEVREAIAKYNALLEASSAYELEDVSHGYDPDFQWLRKDLSFIQAGDNVVLPGSSFPTY